MLHLAASLRERLRRPRPPASLALRCHGLPYQRRIGRSSNAIEYLLDERIGEGANHGVHCLTELRQREFSLIADVEQKHRFRQLANGAPLEVGELVEAFHRMHLVSGCNDAKLPAHAPYSKHPHTPSAFFGDSGDYHLGDSTSVVCRFYVPGAVRRGTLCCMAHAPHVIRPNPRLPITGTVLALAGLMDGKTPKLLDRVRLAIRVRHYSRRTEEAYVYWIRRYIVFHGKVHPAALGAADLSAFLIWLAEQQPVSASTQNQALSAVLFLYKAVLAIEIGGVPPVVQARTPERLPVVLSRDEVTALLKPLAGTMRLVVTLLYGAGLRLEECLPLRVKDLDFDRHQIIVRQGQGRKDRMTMLPAAARAVLTVHFADVRRIHETDLARGFGRVVLPFALDRKFPTAATEWRW